MRVLKQSLTHQIGHTRTAASARGPDLDITGDPFFPDILLCIVKDYVAGSLKAFMIALCTNLKIASPFRFITGTPRCDHQQCIGFPAIRDRLKRTGNTHAFKRWLARIVTICLKTGKSVVLQISLQVLAFERIVFRAFAGNGSIHQAKRHGCQRRTVSQRIPLQEIIIIYIDIGDVSPIQFRAIVIDAGIGRSNLEHLILFGRSALSHCIRRCFF